MKTFFVVEMMNEKGNSVGYLKDVLRDDGIDTEWTVDIHRAIQFDTQKEAQDILDGPIDHALGGKAKNCAVREHAWKQP